MLAQMQIGFGQMINAHQHQRRPQRHGAECAGRHAVYLPFAGLNGDNRNAAGKAPQRGSKFVRCDWIFHDATCSGVCHRQHLRKANYTRSLHLRPSFAVIFQRREIRCGKLSKRRLRACWVRCGVGMYPRAFAYHRAKSYPEAVSLLGELGEEAKFLAGGQSLIPLMKLRLSIPAHLVDLNFIRDTSYIHCKREPALRRHDATLGNRGLSRCRAHSNPS